MQFHVRLRMRRGGVSGTFDVHAASREEATEWGQRQIRSWNSDPQRWHIEVTEAATPAAA